MMHDAIDIGAGYNGLACALHLASRGWKVLVLEQADAPGGAVKTAEVTLPGFRHDLYGMNLSMFASSAFHAEHGSKLAQHGLGFVRGGAAVRLGFSRERKRWSDLARRRAGSRGDAGADRARQ